MDSREIDDKPQFIVTILCGNFCFSADLGFDNWTPWSSCSQTCEGVRKRDRQCIGLLCDGDAEEVENCGTPQCPSKSGRYFIETRHTSREEKAFTLSITYY